MNPSRADSSWALLCCRTFPEFVTKTTGTRSCPWEFTSLRKAPRAAGITLWPRTSTPSTSNRNPKVGGPLCPPPTGRLGGRRESPDLFQMGLDILSESYHPANQSGSAGITPWPETGPQKSPGTVGPRSSRRPGPTSGALAFAAFIPRPGGARRGGRARGRGQSHGQTAFRSPGC